MSTDIRTFKNGTPQRAPEDLFTDTVEVTSVMFDWSDDNAGRSEPRWRSYEAPDCNECGVTAVWDTQSEWVCTTEECSHFDQEVDDETDGPMMNYFYPLPDLGWVDDVYTAASRIRDLPLCVIEWEDGGYALALTGGGMDLSWEICEAFTRLGMLPPLHFCDLPQMSGYPRDADDEYVIEACKRTASVALFRAQRAGERLEERYPTKAADQLT